MRLQESLIFRQAQHIVALEGRLKDANIDVGDDDNPPPVPEKHKNRPKSYLALQSPEQTLEENAMEQIRAWRKQLGVDEEEAGSERTAEGEGEGEGERERAEGVVVEEGEGEERMQKEEAKEKREEGKQGAAGVWRRIWTKGLGFGKVSNASTSALVGNDGSIERG